MNFKNQLANKISASRRLVLISGYYHISGALAREARSGATWVRKCGKLPIQKNLVIT